MKALTSRYSRFADRICDLRAQDREFDEICSDYEELAQAMQRLERDTTTSKDLNGSTILADIRDTLAALDEEISAYLGIAESPEGERK